MKITFKGYFTIEFNGELLKEPDGSIRQTTGKDGAYERTVKLKVDRSNWWNEYIKPTLPRIPFSFRNHQPYSLAVSSILPQLSRY